MNNHLPQLPGIAWDVSPVPGGLSLRALAGAEIAGSAELTLREVAPSEFRADLTCSIDPNFVGRGLGTAMLAWSDSAAAELFRTAGHSGSLTLCANTSAPDAPNSELFAAHGLQLAVAEHEMRRHLTALPERALPQGFTSLAWNEHAQPLFFHAYSQSFRDRPGFPNWEESRWRASFIDSEEFRPELSSVILDGPEPAAYAVIWVEGNTGWITQMGVRPQWRGKGLGELLLARSLHAFAKEGLESAALEVATNNPNARALYERMGFTVVSSYESWRKLLL